VREKVDDDILTRLSISTVPGTYVRAHLEVEFPGDLGGNFLKGLSSEI
jgi:hypothetical protein